MPNNNLPKIIGGTCEFCGVPAYTCQHYQGTVDAKGNRLIAPENIEALPERQPLSDPEPISQIPEFKKVNPLNCKKNSKKILIGCVDFSEFTGMPMYLYNLGKAMIKLGYEITIVSTIGGGMTAVARDAGIKVVSWEEDYQDDYMALILNEPVSERLLAEFPRVPAYNIIHSARPEDEPIPDCPQIRKYFYVKGTDFEYIKDKVPLKKVASLPIPIDFERFNKSKLNDHKGYNILAPCTFDELRKPMLKDLVRRAKEDPNINVIIKGKNYGVITNPAALPRNVLIDEKPEFNIENFMAKADEVAGILLGTVTLEAWAMGLKTSVYNLDGTFEMVKPPKGFKITHDADMVAIKLDRILNEKWADIIIPHHDQPDLLAQTLKSIPIRNYNVVIVRGGYFAQSCNRGAKLATTDKLIFANDDMVLNPQILWEMIDAKEEIVGVHQNYPDGSDMCHGIFINQFGRYEVTSNRKKAIYPSGAIFKIDKDLFNDLGGLCEEYINGGEDQDLFLSALEAGAKTKILDGPVIHYCSQSTGRFEYLEKNDITLDKRWPQDRLKKILGDNYVQNSDLL